MKPDQILAYRQGKPLRPYQQVAAAAVRSELDRGKRVCLVAPTGAGKSRTSLEVMHDAAKGLVITHTRTLRDQSAATIPGCAISTVQALVAKGPGGERRREALKSFDRVFIDECHHIVSEEWTAVIPALAHAQVFGATATPERADGTPLGDVFDSMIVAAKYSFLVSEGYLVPCDIAKPKLSRAQQKKQKVKVDGVASYFDHGLREDGSPRPGIYFAPTISECIDAAERFNAKGVRAAVVSCDVTGEERQRLFDAYSAGHLDMLCSPVALAEGFDSPRAEVCILCRSASSLATYIQMVGRVLRPSMGKLRALLIDCTDAAAIHGSPTADRRYSLAGKGIELDVPEEEREALEREIKEREAWQLIRIEYDIIRDKLKALFVDIQQQATDAGKKPTAAFYDFKRAIQKKDARGFVSEPLKLPYVIDAKKQHVCEHCRHRVKPGETVLQQSRGFYHRDCWFETLSDEQLTAYKESRA